ncbi:eukaryotic translation initiation factor 5B [Nematostella vectensis]|uniref:eukaryotic translation initiation factor 5B n=1 Tax=Nematostella vectensis TaxID=45351 RepID=UPI00207773E0|nr:eukaryotic translation initiation factor 5B [Nematostella vectensis]
MLFDLQILWTIITMCGLLLSKCLSTNNKVAPLGVSDVDAELLKTARSLISAQRAGAKNEVKPEMSAFVSKCSAAAYDLILDGKQTADGGHAKVPRRLARIESAPTLTMEMLLEKQTQVENNRIRQLEKKKKKASARSRSSDASDRRASRSNKLREALEMADKLAKEKSARAAENRDKHLADVKSKASRLAGSSQQQVVESEACAKVELRQREIERKGKMVEMNKDKAAKEAREKLRLRREREQFVKDRANALKDADMYDGLRILEGLETSEDYCVSEDDEWETEPQKDDGNDEEFWG